jgi:hypothetical protein
VETVGRRLAEEGHDVVDALEEDLRIEDVVDAHVLSLLPGERPERVRLPRARRPEPEDELPGAGHARRAHERLEIGPRARRVVLCDVGPRAHVEAFVVRARPVPIRPERHLDASTLCPLSRERGSEAAQGGFGVGRGPRRHDDGQLPALVERSEGDRGVDLHDRLLVRPAAPCLEGDVTELGETATRDACGVRDGGPFVADNRGEPELGDARHPERVGEVALGSTLDSVGRTPPQRAEGRGETAEMARGHS